jgi:DNA polymerase-1
VHDALLIEAPLDELDEATAVCQRAMLEAGRFALSGFELRLETKTVCYPDRFIDEKGAKMWTRVLELLERAENGAAVTVQPEVAGHAVG